VGRVGRDAGRGTQRDRNALEAHAGEVTAYFFEQDDRVLGGGPGQDDDELVATQPHD